MRSITRNGSTISQDGSFGNRIGEWSDIIDLDYGNPGLWDYRIETLKSWAEIVDGFRCDVAPLVPLEFWLRARREVETVRPAACGWQNPWSRNLYGITETAVWSAIATANSIRPSTFAMIMISTAIFYPMCRAKPNSTDYVEGFGAAGEYLSCGLRRAAFSGKP